MARQKQLELVRLAKERGVDPRIVMQKMAMLGAMAPTEDLIKQVLSTGDESADAVAFSHTVRPRSRESLPV